MQHAAVRGGRSTAFADTTANTFEVQQYNLFSRRYVYRATSKTSNSVRNRVWSNDHVHGPSSVTALCFIMIT